MLLESQLVEQAKVGDTGAYEELIRIYQDRLFRFALYMLPTRQDAEDVVQETFIQAYRNLPQFRGDASLHTWLVSIARRKVAMWYRKHRHEDRLSEVPDVAFDDTESVLTQIEMRSVVSSLPQAYREVIVLRYVNQFDVREIADAAGISAAAVGIRLHRARKMLKDRMSSTFGEEVCRDAM